MSKGNILSPKEEIIMACIWHCGPVRVKEIIDLLPEPKPHFNTISTFVRGLQKKGWINHERCGNTHKYSAAVPLDEYRDSSLSRIVSCLFNKDYSSLVDFLYKNGKISAEQLTAIANQ